MGWNDAVRHRIEIMIRGVGGSLFYVRVLDRTTASDSGHSSSSSGRRNTWKSRTCGRDSGRCGSRWRTCGRTHLNRRIRMHAPTRTGSAVWKAVSRHRSGHSSLRSGRTRDGEVPVIGEDDRLIDTDRQAELAHDVSEASARPHLSHAVGHRRAEHRRAGAQPVSVHPLVEARAVLTHQQQREHLAAVRALPQVEGGSDERWAAHHTGTAVGQRVDERFRPQHADLISDQIVHVRLCGARSTGTGIGGCDE